MTSTPPSVQKKTSYHHGNLRLALINAGTDILETQGIESLSLRGTARLAGVSQAAPYSHFKDKTALLASIAERGFQKLSLTMAEDATGKKDSFVRISALVISYINFARDNTALFHLMFGRELANISEFPTLAMTAGKSYALFSSAINAHVGSNQPALTATIWATTHGFAGLLADQKIKPEHIGSENINDFVENILSQIKL